MADHVRVNVGGTRNVLDASRPAGRVVVLSSVAVWGYEFTRDMREDARRARAGCRTSTPRARPRCWRCAAARP